MERKGVEPSTSALRTQGTHAVSESYKELAATARAACTNACTFKDENLHGTQADDGLAEVIDNWPTLLGAVKAGILAMVRAAK